MGRMQRRVVVFIGAVLTLGVAALGCGESPSKSGPSGEKSQKAGKQVSYTGVATTTAVKIFDSSGHLIKVVNLEGEGWERQVRPNKKGLIVYLKKNSYGSVTIDPKTGKVARHNSSNHDEINPYRPNGTLCGGKIYRPYQDFPFDSPFMTVFADSAITKKLGTVEIPRKNKNTKKFFVEVPNILCLDNQALIVRSLESLKPNNLVDRQETLYRMNLADKKFEIIAGPRVSNEQDGFSQLINSPRKDHFYAYELIFAGGGGITSEVIAFRGARELWRAKIPYKELKSIDFGAEHDGRIDVISIDRRARHGSPAMFQHPSASQRLKRQAELEDVTTSVYSLDINTGKILGKEDIIFTGEGLSRMFTSKSGEISFVVSKGAKNRITVINMGSKPQKRTIEIGSSAMDLAPVY